MARLPKCPDCKEDVVDKDKATKISGRWVCEKCLEIRKGKQDERQVLYDYIAKLFNIEYPTIWMKKQVKDFKEDYNYTYKGMELTLRYWTETLGNSMHEAKGIGIVPYIYDEAKEFFIAKMDVNNSVAGMEKPLSVDKDVNILKSKMSGGKQKRSGLIDMDNL